VKKNEKNIAFGQHNILGYFAKTQNKRDRNNNIPGGSLGPGVLLESGHIVQLK
jgi:pantoate kinase